MTNHSWEEETRKYLSQVQSELDSVDKQIEELQQKKETLTHEVDAYQIALQSRLRRTGKEVLGTDQLRHILSEQPNHLERLKRIAERNNGVLKVGSAADIMFNLRLIKSQTRQHAYRIVYRILLDMVEQGQFVKIAPATFRMEGSQSTLPDIH